MSALLIYCGICAFAALYFAFKTNSRIMSFIVFTWVLVHPVIQPILNKQLVVGGALALNSSRILMILLTAYFLLRYIKHLLGGSDTLPKSRQPYAKYILAIVLCAVISFAFNTKWVLPKLAVISISEILLFCLIYYAGRSLSSEKFTNYFLRTVLLLALVNAVISIIQFGVSSEFMKVAPPRLAFAGRVRSSGVFGNEYDCIYVLIMGAVITLVWLKNGPAKIACLLLINLAAITTFHRMGILILAACTGHYFLNYTTTSVKTLTILAGTTIIAMALVYIPLHKQSKEEERFAKDRLAANNLMGRLNQFKLVIDDIGTHVVGIADYSNPAYFRLMAKGHHLQSVQAPDGSWTQVPYKVHNGYLEIAVLYGIHAMIIYMLFHISLFRYFKNKMARHNPSHKKVPSPYAIAYYIVFMWMCANLTNPISDFGVYPVLLIALLIGVFSASIFTSIDTKRNNGMKLCNAS